MGRSRLRRMRFAMGIQSYFCCLTASRLPGNGIVERSSSSQWLHYAPAMKVRRIRKCLIVGTRSVRRASGLLETGFAVSCPELCTVTLIRRSHGSLVTAHLRVDRNDSSTAADLRRFQNSFRSPCRECTPPASQPRCFEQAEELNCCDRTAIGRKTAKCRLQKRTGWLLTLWIDGRISRRAFPQKSAGTLSSSFEPFGWQPHVTPN